MRIPLGAAIAIPLLILGLAGCAYQPSGAVSPSAPSFWLGLWHGFIAPMSLIGSFFASCLDSLHGAVVGLTRRDVREQAVSGRATARPLAARSSTSAGTDDAAGQERDAAPVMGVG